MRHTNDIVLALKAIKDSPNPNYGICDQIRRIIGRRKFEKHSYILSMYWVKWKHYSGDIFYPVPGPHPGLSAFDSFSLASTGEGSWRFWGGPYGKLRLDLLNFLIDELEKET